MNIIEAAWHGHASQEPGSDLNPISLTMGRLTAKIDSITQLTLHANSSQDMGTLNGGARYRRLANGLQCSKAI